MPTGVMVKSPIPKTKAPISKSRLEASRARTDWNPFLLEDTEEIPARDAPAPAARTPGLTCFGVFRRLAWKPWKM